MSLAQWITLPNLGSFLENYNFNLNPFSISVASDYGSTIFTLNGNLPPGLNYTKINSAVVISGQSTGVTEPTTYYFTLRVVDPDGTVADRTYNITITPILIVPSWSKVNPFLGYMTVNTTANFTATATISNNNVITYSLIPAPGVEYVPAGMSINAQTGIITYINSVTSPVPPNFDQTYTFTVVATSGQGSENLTAYIIVLGRDHAPGWISTGGTIGTFINGAWVEYIFYAYEPNGNDITYSLSNTSSDFPYNLTYSGFLYGEAPLTLSSTTWIFTVNATSNLGTSQRVFEITVVAGPGNQITANNTTNGELGTWLDGSFVAIYVQSTSQRSPRIQYKFIGGSLPPNLKLNTAQGIISGFLEYHPQPKDYYFEIQSSDGFQTDTVQYHMNVERSVLDKFIDINLPIDGQIKEALWQTKNAMVQSPLMIQNVNIEPMDLVDSMNIVSGLSFQYDNADNIMQQICQQSHSTNLLIGHTSNSNINTSGYTVFYRNIIDFQANASPITTRLVGNIISGTNYINYVPISINNIRNTLISNVGFANDGAGEGATFIVSVNQYTNGIQNVFVSNSGFGYYSAPLLEVVGSGNGAIITANLSVQSVTVTNGGNGWTQGEVFNVIIDESHTLQLQSSSVGFNGYLNSVSVINGGNFTEFPRGNKVITDTNSAIATVSFDLGISTVNIINAGSGYNPIIPQLIISSGSEILPIWQPTWAPILYISPVNINYSDSVWSIVTPELENILSNIVWTVQWIELVAQGRSWAGNSTFDLTDCTFDGDQTRFIEWIEPKDTIFDFDGNTTFDNQGTVFDGNKYVGGFMADMWGKNIWNPNTIIFDVYTNLLTDVDVSTVSSTEVKRVYRLRSQRVGNYNKSV